MSDHWDFRPILARYGHLYTDDECLAISEKAWQTAIQRAQVAHEWPGLGLLGATAAARICESKSHRRVL